MKMCHTEFKGGWNKYLGVNNESQTDGEEGRYNSRTKRPVNAKENFVLPLPLVIESR